MRFSLLPIFTLNCRFVFLIMFTLTVIGFFSQPMALQQAENDEHAGHHPSKDEKPTNEIPSIQPGIDASSMMGPGMGKGMDKMMEKMGAPKPKDLYPSLMRMQSATPEQTTLLLSKATERMRSGNEQLSNGFTRLAEASQAEDYAQMQIALETVKEGIAHFDSGLATKRALLDGQEPRRVALTWFKTQMDILPSIPEDNQTIILGMTPFHTSIMVILLLFAVVMIYVYGLKMRRASVLLAQLKNDEKNTQASGTSQKNNTGLPTNTDTPIVDVETATSVPTNNGVNSDLSASIPVNSADSGMRRKVFSGEMKVTAIFIETHDVKTFRFAHPNNDLIPFSYEPGQFVTFSLQIDGVDKLVKRSYTIASSPTQTHYFEVTIKREEHGVVSRFLHDNVKVGDSLKVKAPGGKFFFNGKGENSVMLISGGVGITPMMSAVRYLTTTCWDGDIYFLFCTRTTKDFIFEQELRYLQARYSNLKVLVSMTQAKGTSWMGPQGRLTSGLIQDFVPEIEAKTAHICGPPAMMEGMKGILSGLGVPESQIKTEAFGPATPKSLNKHNVTQQVLEKVREKQITFSLSGKQAPVNADETILDVADSLDIDIDNSCRAGSCGSCKVKLTKGAVEMDVDDGLEPQDKKEGYILACQAIPTSDVEVEA